MKEIDDLLVFWSIYLEVKHRLGDDLIVDYILDTMQALKELKEIKRGTK